MPKFESKKIKSQIVPPATQAEQSFRLDLEKPWHHLEVDEVLQAVSSSADGLSYVSARQRLRHLGANKLPRSRPMVKVFSQPLLNPFTYLLIGLGIYLQVNGAEGWALIGAGLCHGGAGIYLSLWSLRAREKVNRDRPQRHQHDHAGSVRVIRDREEMEVPSRDVVIGDIVLLQTGDRPNIDLRLIEVSEDLVVNQTNLGGAAICQRRCDVTFAEKTAPLECLNMLYAGSEISSGVAKGVVVATGRFTQEQSALHREQPYSTIHSELQHLRQVWLGILLVTAAAANGLAWQRGIMINLMASAAIILSTYPQNLLRIATQLQLVGMLDLAKQRIWVRFPAVLDALSRVTTIVPILESDVVLSFDNLSQGGIAWRGLIRASADDAQSFGNVIGIETHSYFDASPSLIRQWQGERRPNMHAVAVIGNDVEDISLLRLADVGICDRTCVKELQDSANLILPKEDFHYLPIAILEGRAIFDRLQRMVTLVAVTSFTLAIVNLMDTAAGFSIPPLQLLWIGAIAMPLLAYPLSLEPIHPQLLQQPAHRFQTLLRTSNYLRILLIVGTIITTISLVFGLKYQGDAALLSQARSMVFVTLVFSQIFHACAIARHSFLKNVPLLLSIAVIASLQVAFMEIPWFGDIMTTVPLTGIEWAISIVSASTIFWVQQIIKT
ncbi:MAG: cation transporting ATPase C-terminal domain-containing protein [Pseudanabaenaceae cyanobacterium bins.39]|nr:cation transporting ATPase C-terminal domain-containing protein [Pseudanabaenaceae cyanobacterium bins.39]